MGTYGPVLQSMRSSRQQWDGLAPRDALRRGRLLYLRISL